MVIGHSLFRPGLHVLIARATGHDEQARERVSSGTTWPRTSAMRQARCSVSGRMRRRLGDAVRWRSGGIAAECWPADAWLVAVENDGTDVVTTLDQTAAHRDTATWPRCGCSASVAVVFWLTAQQAGSSLAVFAAVNTEPQIALLSHALPLGPGLFASLHGLMVIAMLPIFLYLHGRSQSRAGSTAGKLVWGYVATASAFALMAAASLRGGDAGRVSGAWLVGCYALLSLAEILLAPSVCRSSRSWLRGTKLRRPWDCGLRAAPQATDSRQCWASAGTAGRITNTSQRWRRYRWPLRPHFCRAGASWIGSPHAADSASQPEAEDRLQTMTPTASPNAEPMARRSLPVPSIGLQAGLACCWWPRRSCCQRR